MTEEKTIEIIVKDGNNYVRTSDTRPHPHNPRGKIDTEALEFQQFLADIKQRGIIQPLVFLPNGLTLAGHRRRTAAVMLEMELLPATIRALGEGEFPEDYFLSENMQRQDLSVVEEARAIESLRKRLEKQQRNPVTNAELARRLNMVPATLNARLKVLELPERTQNWFHKGEIPLNSSTVLYRLFEYPAEIDKFADRMAARQITLSSLPKLVDSRLKVLGKEKNSVRTGQREKTLRAVTGQLGGGIHTPLVTRTSALANLNKAQGKSISVFDITRVLDAVCCACGMMGSDEVCNNCPLPKLVNGIAGRARASGDDDEDFS